MNFTDITKIFIFLCNLFILLFVIIRKNYKNKAFFPTPWLYPLGIFVWGDALLISIFWLLVTITCFLLNDWLLFLLFIAIFWVVRSLGEVIYWLLEQFSSVKRNKPQNLFGYALVKNESIFFVYQVFWQCCLVFSIIISLYLAHLWLISL